jgi:hypothetical protein
VYGYTGKLVQHYDKVRQGVTSKSMDQSQARIWVGRVKSELVIGLYFLLLLLLCNTLTHFVI